MRRCGATLLWLLLWMTASHAHGVRDGPKVSWTVDPWITMPLLISAGIYAKGMFALNHRARLGRGLRRRQAALYTAGWLALAGALVSPLHELGEQLFTAHMVEHEIVMAIAAPLLVLARPGGIFLWAFPAKTRRRIGRLIRAGALRGAWVRLTQPLTATILRCVAIWAWHVPLLFDAAVTNIAVHRLQHLSFFLTAVLFWWALLRRAKPGVAAADLFITMTHTGILGALMTFAPRVLYQVQTAHAARWGLTPLEDQQLAGLVMWVPAGTVYAGAAIAFAAEWVRGSSRRRRPDHALAS
jgi:putative membrane protein